MDEFLRLSGSLQAVMVAIGVAPSALLAVLAFIFKERLKHALAKSLNEHTEQLKLDAQREMEAYKVTLIANIERQKAQSELRKAIAIKHATLEYEALITLHAQLGDVPAAIVAAASVVPSAGLNQQERSQTYETLEARRKSLEQAIAGAHLFVSPETSIQMLDVHGIVLDLLHRHVFLQTTQVPAAPVRQQLNEAVNALRNIVRDRVAQLILLAD